MQTNCENTNRTIRRITLVGAAINILLSAVKITVGLLSGSQALVADGVHSLSDLVTDAAVVVGARYWNSPPDESHPYGHGRLETLISIFIGTALAAVAVGIGWHSISTLHIIHESAPGWHALAAALLSIALKEGLFRWTVAHGRRIHSRALIANAWHHRSDALSSVPVVIAVIGSHAWPSVPHLDHMAALVVTAMLLKAAFDIASPAVLELMESRGDSDIERQISDIAANIPEIYEIHKIRSRHVGSAVCIDMHMLVAPQTPVKEAHDTADKLKKSIMDSDPRIADVLIHIEPIKTSPTSQ